MMNVKDNRLASIEAFRFFCMLIIILWHFSRFNPFTYGYIVVDFFFMLSGFFLYKSFYRSRQSAYAYTINKVKKFAPEYVLVFLLSFSVKSAFVYKSDSLSVFFSAIPELLMIQGVGFGSVINTPTWYISVMLIAGFAIYALLKVEILAESLLSISVIGIYIYLFHRSPSIETFDSLGLLYLPLLRGFAGMGYGVLVSMISIRCHSFLENKYAIINVLTLISLGVVMMDLFMPRCLDKYALLAFGIILSSFSVSRSFLNIYLSSPIWNKLGGITYEMLLLHAFIIGVVAKLIRGYYLSPFASFIAALIYVCIVLLGSLLLKRFAVAVRRINRRTVSE